MRDFEYLEVWQAAHGLALRVYGLTERLPECERWVLVPQMRRAGNSVPGNVAEGAGLESNAQLIRHLIISSGSLSEVESYARLARDLGYIATEEHMEVLRLIHTTGRLIWGYVRYLRRQDAGDR